MYKEEIRKFFRGEIRDDKATLDAYSTDASLFRVRPSLVVFPKDSLDLANLVKWVSANPGQSLTIRAAGSDMSGGPLNEGIIADVTKHINRIGEVVVEPGLRLDEAGYCLAEAGAFYRDFEKKTLDRNLILPCYTASKNLCALGGMFANNCAGEKSLRYGKMEKFVLESKVIFSDGNEYIVKPLTHSELAAKIAHGGFEGTLYSNLYNLIERNKALIRSSKPQVSKNSAGYYLWNVMDGDIFDLNKLLVGSQGTLGVITEMKLSLVPVEPVSKLEVIFLNDLSHMADLVNEILPTNPESIESYDSATMKLAFRFLPEMLKSMKIKHFFKLIFSFIPEVGMMLSGGIPKLVMLVEYTGQSEKEVDEKMKNLKERIAKFHYAVRLTKSVDEADKYWTVRRESFNLLRKHTKGRRTAPFVDDVVIKPEHMPEFLPKMRAILDSYNLTYTIAGHAGQGNFHIIPLMNMKDKKNVKVIEEVSEKVYDLVREYKGSISGEHNDGIIRTPYLHKMYSPEILELFKQTKEIFDPKNIFNPGKKVPSSSPGQVAGTLQYMTSHVDIK